VEGIDQAVDIDWVVDTDWVVDIDQVEDIDLEEDTGLENNSVAGIVLLASRNIIFDTYTLADFRTVHFDIEDKTCLL
jgi:hypothetical protein